MTDLECLLGTVARIILGVIVGNHAQGNLVGINHMF